MNAKIHFDDPQFEKSYQSMPAYAQSKIAVLMFARELDRRSREAGWGAARQLQGKELSYNNLIDLEAALATVREFGYGKDLGLADAGLNRPAAVVIKHTNPCGVATGAHGAEALLRALDADRVSAFGGIVALNRPVDGAAAEHLAGLFLECVVAPSFGAAARERLAAKPNLRLLELDPAAITAADRRQLRSVLGGVLVQEFDDQPVDASGWQLFTVYPAQISGRPPLPKECREIADLVAAALNEAALGRH
jgi:phosphoribosylaminoimidazolecarboxamide formyltransferase/IMP cyclohydrolase